MKRRDVAAILVAAALVGGGGGAYVAITGDRDQQTAQPGGPGTATQSAAPSGTPSGTPHSPTPNPHGGGLFYLAGKTIHDGDRNAKFRSRGGDWWIQSLERVGDSWLVVEGSSDGGEQYEFEGSVVHEDGEQVDLGPLGQSWDVDSEGRILASPKSGRWVSIDPATGDATELPLTDGPGEQPEEMADGEPRQWIQAVGDDVLTWWTAESGSYLIRSERDGSEHVQVGPAGSHYPAVSPSGELAVAQDEDPDATGADGFCTIGGELTTSDWWRTCDWRVHDRYAPYSPDGTRLLAVDIRSDGFGPGGFTVLDAATGDEQFEMEAPPWTSGAVWLDNSTLLVEVNGDGDPTGPSTLYEVNVENGEQEKVKSLKRDVTLGEG